jgi:hypothetical protein
MTAFDPVLQVFTPGAFSKKYLFTREKKRMQRFTWLLGKKENYCERITIIIIPSNSQNQNKLHEIFKQRKKGLPSYISSKAKRL